MQNEEIEYIYGPNVGFYAYKLLTLENNISEKSPSPQSTLFYSHGTLLYGTGTLNYMGGTLFYSTPKNPLRISRYVEIFMCVWCGDFIIL